MDALSQNSPFDGSKLSSEGSFMDQGLPLHLGVRPAQPSIDILFSTPARVLADLSWDTTSLFPVLSSVDPSSPSASLGIP